MPLAQVITPPVHFRTGQMVLGEVQFQLGVTAVFTAWKAGQKFPESFLSQPGQRLVPFHIGNLFVIAEPLQIIGIGRIRIGRMQLDKTVQGGNGIVVFACLVLAESGHQLGFGRPFGIGVLAFHFLEQCRRLVVFLFFQGILGFVVEFLDRPFHIVIHRVIAGTGRQADNQH